MNEKIDVLLTRDYVSKVLNISLSSVDRMRQKGGLKIERRIGNVILFDSGSVSQAQEFLQLREIFSGKGQ